MATDMARLLIVVTTKGAKEAAKEQDKVTNSSKRMANQTKKSTKEQKRFTTAQNTFRNTLPGVASGVYLVQQAFKLVATTMGTMTQAYSDQYTAEVKLQTIMRSTGEAVGYNYDQLYNLSKAWEAQTGINDSAILSAQGIAATFTQISQEVFPQVIEQALNMSSIFGQQMQQSILQLGNALNAPIKGVGRLRRIGISFTDTQREMIKNFVKMGDVVSAQTVILDEIEQEIGQVAAAMGDTSLGKIKKFNNAWTNMFEEIGEKATNFWSKALDDTKAQEAVDKITKTLEGLNSRSLVDTVLGMEGIDQSTIRRLLPMHELQAALDSIQKELDGIIILDDLDLEAINMSNVLKVEQQKIANILNDIVAESGWKNLTGAMELLYGTPEGYSKKQQDFLDNLRAEYIYKNGLLKLDELSLKTTTGKTSELDEYNKKIAAGVALGIEAADVDKQMIGYTSARFSILDDEEKLARELLKTENQRKAIDLYGSDEQKKQQEHTEAVATLNTLVAEGTPLWTELAYRIDAAFVGVSGIVEAQPTESFFGYIYDDIERAKASAERFEVAMQDISTTIKGMGVDALSGSFDYLGASMAGLDKEAASWESLMLDIIASSLSTIGPNLMATGAMMLLESRGKDPVGWALLAGGASASFVGGFMSQTRTNAQSVATTSSSTTVTPNAIAPTITDASTTSTTADTSSTPVTINNYGDANVSAEMTSVNGKKVLQVTVDSLVNNGVANGTYNRSMSNQFGVSSQRTRVR